MITHTLSQKLLGVQQRIGAVTKSASNPHFKSKYADLNEVLDVAKEALNSSGVFISQSPGANEFGKYLETSLIDGESGQSISGRVYFSGNEDNMQKIGAAITYARRFGLKSLLAMEDTDDDGETAVGRGKEANTQRAAGPPVNSYTNPVGGIRSQPAATVPGTPLKTILSKITLTSKVLIDSKRASQEELEKFLTSYAVKMKEELTLDQATKLLSQLETKLKGQ